MPVRRSAAACPSSGASSSVRASTIRCGSKCEEPVRGRSRWSASSTRAPSCSSSGAATASCSGASMRWPGRKQPSRSSPPGLRTSSQRTSGSRSDIEQAVSIGLRGERRKLDVGRFNGERFAVMAGAGFDASMIQEADGGLKDRLGRLAYVGPGPGTCGRSLSTRRSRLTGFPGMPVPPAASSSATSAACSAASRSSRMRAPTTDGSRSASSTRTASRDWVRTFARTAVGQAERSPLVQATSATKIKVKLDRKVLYEVDGGDRKKVKSFTIKVQPAAITICTPEERSGDTMATVQRDSVRVGAPGAIGRRGIRQLAALCDPLAGRVRRPRAGLRDHRRAGVRSRDRARRQDHEPAGRAAGRSSSIPSVTSCSRSSPSVWAATRSGGSSAPLSATAVKAPTAGSSASAPSAAGSRTPRCASSQSRSSPAQARPGRERRRRPSDVFAWPAGRWLVGDRRARAGGVAVLPAHPRASRKKFLDDSKTEQMPQRVEQGGSRCSARSVTSRARSSSGWSASSSSRRPIDYKANEAIGLDGALREALRRRVRRRGFSAPSPPG